MDDTAPELARLQDLPRCDSLYISPHADDVARACAGRLASEAAEGHRILVVAVFASEGSDPAVPLLRERGIEVRTLALPEAARRDPGYGSYRGRAFLRLDGDLAWLARATDILRELAHRSRAREVYVPLGVGGDIDHRLCHEAALDAFESGEGRNVFLYEERPESLVPGAVRVRLAQVGARLPPAAFDAASPSGFGRFLFRFHVAPSVRGELDGWSEALRTTGDAWRQWRGARTWNPQRSRGPRLQPILHPVEAAVPADELRALAAAGRPPRAPRLEARLRRMADAYARQLGSPAWIERYWLLLPVREVEGEVRPSQMSVTADQPSHS